MIPQYNTVLFHDVFENDTEFLEEYKDSPFHEAISDTDTQLLYFLLLARYGNTPIANASVDQFKLKMFATIFQFGPVWVKKLDIQKQLRNMGIDELMQGTKIIYNHAYNQSDGPYTSSLKELDFINDQNTANYKTSKIDALSKVWDYLDVNATEEFLSEFIPLFKVFILPDVDAIYGEDDICQ